MSSEQSKSTLRRRNNHNSSTTQEKGNENEIEPLLPSNTNSPDPNEKQKKPEISNTKIPTTYWLTSILILRSIAFIYLIAFCVAYFQNNALIGVNGIYPYTSVINQYSSHYNSNWDKFVNLPTFLWFMPQTNDSIDKIALCGIILSSLVIIFGYRFCHVIIFISLWLLYHSLVNVGQLFYGYGWESQLLETGFLAIFLCRFRIFSWKYRGGNNDKDKTNPFLSLDQKPAVPPSYIILYLFLWLTFRIMIGAGMIKIRAGGCWLDYTCMDYHYETQPNPSPISWLMHNNPHWFHAFEVGVNHFAELIAPWFLLIPFRKITLFAAFIQIFFQILIIISGNLSFLNWLTIIPSLAGLDDLFCYNYLWFLFWPNERQYLYNQCANYYCKYQKHQDDIETRRSLIVNESSSFMTIWRRFKFFNIFSFSDLMYKILCIIVLILIGYLSQDVVNNLLSSRQVMNTSFDKFRIVNTYGAFGHVGQERFEVVLEMTNDDYIDDDTEWKEILFKCKPGPIDRTPCLITPYHYRLDWQIWFCGFPPHTPNRHPWIFLFVAQLLSHDKDTIELLDGSVKEYMDKNNVTYIKADMYKYTFTSNWNDKNWWNKELRNTYLPPLNLQNKQFQDILGQLSWTGLDGVNKKKKRKKKSKKKRRRK